ncbi:MAG: hypothetical protein B0D91_08900 [Oceanospirillales bacterium LUC14_002_19_P2]|nr:MAG: hypothetical protein B0D91_08900 [Oceanospirillales bacterium LUC14_002_19_P2]
MYEKIWLAGLGAYARSEKKGQEGKAFFDELVVDGEKVRDRASDKIDELKGKAKDSIGEVVDKVRDILKLEKDKDTEELSLQIEALSKAVSELAAVEKKAAPAKKSA